MQVARKIENVGVAGARPGTAATRGGPVGAMHADLAERLQAGTHARWHVAEPSLVRVEWPAVRTVGLALAGGLAIGASVIALFLA